MLTLEHQRQWVSESGGSLATSGRTHNLEWRVGPEPAGTCSAVYVGGGRQESPAIDTCKVCEQAIDPGQTVVQTLSKEQYGWRHVRCFDWSAHDLGDLAAGQFRRPTGPGFSREVTKAAAAKQLMKAAQASPRFKVSVADTVSNAPADQALLQAVLLASQVVAELKPARATKPVEVKVERKVIARVHEIAVLAEHAAKPVAAIAAESALPEWAEDWLSGLVYAPKATYAREYLAHILLGAPEPSAVSAEWAVKARKRADQVKARAA